MNKIYTLLACILASTSHLAFAQFPEISSYHADPGAHERNRNIDVEHMLVDVSFEPQIKLVKGTVTHTFQSLQNYTDTIFFDAPGIKVKTVTLDGQSKEFRTIPEGLVVITHLLNDFHKKHVIQINYEATPSKGIYFVGWNLPEIEDPAEMSRRQIWTQGQGIDNRHWIPMIDDRGDKFITETKITFDADYQVLSNGQLMSKLSSKGNNGKSQITWHYRMPKPHAGYLLMLAIDKYGIKNTKTKRGTPVQFWYYPEHPERVEPTSKYSEKIIEFLEDETGIAYAWGSYAQVMVQDFLYGAMENTSATVFGDFFWIDSRGFLDKNYIGVNAHEATHQWFGDLITGRHDGEQWLQESFATFYPGLFNKEIFGDDEMSWYFRSQMNGAIAAGKQNSLPVRNSLAGSSRHYPKGASVLYMLQHVLGRDNFRRAIKLYLDRHSFQTVETWDLQKAIIDATGINMDWFFDQWIHKGGEPKFKVTTEIVQRGPINKSELTTGLEFTVEQTQKLDPIVGIFKMPIDFAVFYTDGSVDRKTVMIDKVSQKVFFPTNGKTVAFKLFDEGGYVLKEVDFEKPTSELLIQLQKSSTMLDRYDAIVALNGKLNKDQFISLVSDSKFNNEFREIAVEIAKIGLIHDRSNPVADSIIANHKYPEVRRVFYQLARPTSLNSQWFLKGCSDSSYINIELALDRIYKDNSLSTLCLSQAMDQVKQVQGYTHNIKIKYCEYGVEVYPEMRGSFIKTLISMSGEKYEFRTRILALQSLQRLNYVDKESAFNLFDGCINFNSRLNTPALEVLSYFLKQNQLRKILKSAILEYKPMGGIAADIEKLKRLQKMIL